MLLTDAQIREIRQIIADHHTAFVASVISPDAVDPEVLERLKEMGLVDVKIASVEDAYLYGQVLGALDDTKGMTYDQFKEHVRKRPVPLTAIEKSAIDMAQHSAGQYAVGLGNKISVETGNIIYEADAELRAQMRGEIQDLTAENTAKRESVKKLKSKLGWATRDWARDWDRIAVTEKHTAMERGQADHIAKRYGEDARVFKRLEPSACPSCVRLYQGPDGHPRIFKLSELEANGTNFNKKQADWLPVIGDHPWGQCTLNRLPAGWGFDEHGRLSPKGKGGIEYDGEEDLALALMQEDDLQKAFKLQGHTEFQGLPIAIENKPGSVRKWKSPDGENGETRMKFAYGFVKRTRGADGDEIDVFLGPDPRAKMAYVIHQQDPKTGRYDEDKVMLGFSNQKLAESAYQEHYDNTDFMITTSPMTVDHFKRWIKWTEPSELFKAGEPVLRHVIPCELIEKSGPFIGPRGGKWADIKHTIPWTEGKYKKPGKSAVLAAKDPVSFLEALSSWYKDDPKQAKSQVWGPTGKPQIIPWDSYISQVRDQKHPEHAEAMADARDFMTKVHDRLSGKAATRAKKQAEMDAIEEKYEAQGVDVDGPMKMSSLRGKKVWLYHGTSSKLEGKIRKDGIAPATEHGKQSNVGSTAMAAATPDFVYLTSETTGPGSAQWYARAAAAKHGGDPVIIRVLVDGDDLSRDPDDVDIKSGTTQFVVDRVTPGEIKEIDGDKLKKSMILRKAGPFIGPRGGKWQDPQHKIPWREKKTQTRSLNDGYEGVVTSEMSLAEAEHAIHDLPVEHFVALDEKGRMLFRVKGSVSRVDIPPRFIKRLKNTVFTHNHPSNGCLSKDDINLGVTFDVSEIRAVCADGSGTYVLKRPAGGWVPPEDMIGEPNDFQTNLGMAWNAGVARSIGRMDDLLRDTSGPLSSHNLAFDSEVFDGFVAAETFRTYNEGLGKKYGWTIEKEAPETDWGPIDKKERAALRAAKQKRDARKRGRARQKPGRGVQTKQLALFKARVDAIVGAADAPAAARAPGQSSAANYAFTIPVKPRPATVLPEDMMSIKDGTDRDQRIKLDKETFEVRGPFHKEPQMMILPVGVAIDEDEVERNRKHLDEMYRGRVGWKNQIPVEEAKP